jgi:hypothetical protein
VIVVRTKAMARARIAAVLASLAVAAAWPAAAQQATPTPDKAATSIFAKLAAESSAQADQQKPNAAASLPADLLRKDAEDLAAYVKWQREFARQSWDWHLFSTKLLMYVVLTIVGFGLVITYLQFTRDGRRQIRATRVVGRVAPNPAGPATTMTATNVIATVSSSVPLPAAPAPTAPPAPTTPAAAERSPSESVSASTVKIGPGGLEVTSQVIGLLVLAFSLAFFYLYVKVVYPMQEVELQRQADSVSAAAPEAGAKTPRQ